MKTWKVRINKEEWIEAKLLKADAEKFARNVQQAFEVAQYRNEINGVHGGEIRESVLWSPFGPSGAVADPEAYQADLATLRGMIPALVTVAEAPAILAKAKEIFKKHIPIDDKRRTKDAEQERIDEQKAEREQWELRDIERKKQVEIGRELFRKHIPANAQALIIAELDEDESELQTDYHGHSVTERVIIGYSMHKRDLFPEMREAAASFPETAHLGPGKGHFTPYVIIDEDFCANGSYYHKGQGSHWHRELDEDDSFRHYVFPTLEEAQAFIESKGHPESISFDGNVIPFRWEIEARDIEHREKYSMGAGYYLKDGWRNSSGWMVRKETKYGDDWRDEYYEIMAARCIFTEREQSDPEPQKARVDSVTIRHNEEKAGIEIIFPAKPEATVINRLKSMGFRWSRFQGLWWRRFDEAVMAELQASL